MYNVTLRRVRKTIVAAEKHYVLLLYVSSFVGVCIQSML
jgi:hypothetical protein